jgi:class 3 adenylate cyclase
MNVYTDVRPVLPAIQVPTLVVHRVDDPIVAIENARYLAAHIPEAKLVELPGDDHLVFVGDTDRLVDEIEEFLTGHRSEPSPNRILATVLFTDIVDATRRVSELGDQRWRQILDRHDDLVRDQLRRFGGREVKAIGDGFLAAFEGPARAVRCAQTIVRRAATGIGLEVRAGVHTGECDARGDDLTGITVHVGSRMCELAAPGEVLVTSTVRDLVWGSGLEFCDRGPHTLKDIPGEWTVLAVLP